MASPDSNSLPSTDLRQLLGGAPAYTDRWMRSRPAIWFGWSLLWIGLGAGLYGAAIGAWRDPMQSVWNAVKFPLILLLTAFGNSFLNAALAPLLGVTLGWRESLSAILLSFNLLAAILASFSPLVLFLVRNLPPAGAGWQATQTAYSTILVTQSLVIAFAGIAANLRLLRLLGALAGSKSAARRLVAAWLAANLMLGAQLAWICRPFFGRPGMEVQFLRDDAFRGNFFESFFLSLSHLFRN